MRISTKGIYALEFIADLAMHSDDEHLESLRNIAFRRGLSEKYMERIIKALKQAGLVHSVRGAYGGYGLQRPAEDITVQQVLNAAEGQLEPVACLTKETDCGVNCDTCPTRGTWTMMWEEILGVVNHVTIADIVEKTAELEIKK